MAYCCSYCSHYGHWDISLYDSISGILQYDMIVFTYLLRMIYVVAIGLVDSVGGGGVMIPIFIFGFTDCSFYYWATSYRCMLVITLLLHMLYVI